MNKHLTANRRLWNHRVPAHASSDSYNLQAFRSGQSTLSPTEIAEVGDVADKSLLHLQCHFGLDTLSWARRGATVTGLDFSPAAIDLAKSLASELELKAEFVCAQVAEAPRKIKQHFDIVFASYGVLTWLPDLGPWARAVARSLAPRGVFYLIDFHPILAIFDDTHHGSTPRVGGDYFHRRRPIRSVPQGSYAYNDHRSRLVSYQWRHTVADVLDALIRHGLQIDFLHEFSFARDRVLPQLRQDSLGRWRLPTGGPRIPLMFSLRARRPLGDCHTACGQDERLPR